MYNTITDAKLGFEDFQENPSGIEEQAWFIPLSWLLTEQTTTPGTTAISLIEITTAHIMATGKTPIELTPMFEKSGANSESVGQMLSKMFKPGAKFFIPQVNAQNLGTATMLKNARGIVLIKRANGGDFYQFGTKKLPAYIMNPSVSLGEGAEGEVGITLEIAVSASIVPFYIYKGVVPVTGV
jgi:hypothetical protein